MIDQELKSYTAIEGVLVIADRTRRVILGYTLIAIVRRRSRKRKSDAGFADPLLGSSIPAGRGRITDSLPSNPG